MDLIDKFEKIRDWFEKQDTLVKKREGHSFFRTEHGLWGATGMHDIFELFLKNEEFTQMQFTDFGSGDGRIVLIAALFMNNNNKARGIEGSKELVALANKAKEDLKKDIPELERVEFECANYYEKNLEEYGSKNNQGILFFYPDHSFTKEFQEKIQKEFTGYVFVYNNIHSPTQLKKGKTYWHQQVPMVSYFVNGLSSKKN